MTHLLDNTFIKSIEMNNRAVRSATWSGTCDPKGYVTDLTLDFYGRLAQGSMGLIITGYQYILPNGIQLPFMIGNYDDSQIPGLKKLADTIHMAGGKVVGQIVHTGFRATPKLFPAEGEIWAPSEISDPTLKFPIKVVSKTEILELIQAYAAAARRLKEAGFDGVQLHAAHGYGINQFLSPCWNKRSDNYGGSLSNRYRFLAETMEAVRAEIGDDMPLLTKLNVADFVQNGLEIEETVQIGKRLADDGIDAIEISGGSASSGKLGPLRTKIRSEEDEAYFSDMSAYFKEKVKNVPIILVGGFRSLKKINEILDDKKADYISMARPFIREPGLIARWKNGDLSNATCVSCNGCFETGLKGHGISCKIDREEKQSKDSE